MSEIKEYYNNLAATYDDNRFANSYGRYIHTQEVSLLSKIIPQDSGLRVLDIACGTGRLTSFATDGSDIAENMIAIAQENFPDKQFQVADATNLDYPDNSFDIIYSFHFFMHLDHEVTQAIFAEVLRILKPGGRFIFDFPSATRRTLSTRRQKGWHGNNILTTKKCTALLGNAWKTVSTTGILFLPIHRVPKKLRPLFTNFDSLLCKSPLKELASYITIEVEKK